VDLKRYEEAIVALKKTFIKNESFSPARFYLVASDGHSRKHALAKIEVEEIRRRHPASYSGKRPQIPLKNPKYFYQISEGLAMVGLM
jgi:hypothetical protein